MAAKHHHRLTHFAHALYEAAEMLIHLAADGHWLGLTAATAWVLVTLTWHPAAA